LFFAGIKSYPFCESVKEEICTSALGYIAFASGASVYYHRIWLSAFRMRKNFGVINKLFYCQIEASNLLLDAISKNEKSFTKLY